VRGKLGLTVRFVIVGMVLALSILSTTSPLGPVGLTALPYVGVGAILVVRRPRTSIGWILLGVGLCYALVSIPAATPPEQFTDGTVDLPAAIFAIVHSGMGQTSFLLMAALVIVFPSGRLPRGRWRRVVQAGLGASLALTLAIYVQPELNVGFPVAGWVPNPIALLPDLAIWMVLTPTTLNIPVTILLLAGAVSLVVRARRTTGVERQQLRWISASFAAVISTVVGGLVITTVVPGSEVFAWIPAMVAFPTVPIAIGMAVLRYRLYEIDRIISRTISYGAVSAILLIVYAGLILLLQGPLGAITGGDTVAVAASTLVAAALFQPLRRRTQAAVDHRFNRARYDAELTIDALAALLRDEMDLPIVQGAFVGAVERSIQPTSASLWLRPEQGN
jgi:hypothetical protein